MVAMASTDPSRRRCGRRRKNRTENGFTLMEVMVALSVVAIALTAIYRMHSQTLFMDARSRFDTVATMLARQKIADIDAIDLADLSSDNGDFDNDYPGYAWQIQSEAVSSDLLKEDGPVLKRITVTISFNGEESLFTLTTYRHLYE
jgi:general secretion pathway protein I